MEASASNVKEISLVIKWSGSEYNLTGLTEFDTVGVLKHEIFKLTQVNPKRQKLLNLKYKGKLAGDDVRLGNMELLKPNFKVMMIGSLEADIAEVCNVPEDVDDVIDDFEVCKEGPLECSEIYLTKVQRRIKDYEVKILNPSREGKKLLVLDIDYTLFDHRSSAESGVELMRPYLHEFLTSAYEHYDIVIWSATGMRWIEEKMKLLGVSSHSDYKIAFQLDWGAMISVYTAEKGIMDVKPLGVIWGKFPQYTAQNTIMFDDIRRNFLMNPKNGLRIRPFREAHLNRGTDKELLKLSKYLRKLATHCEDFTTINHRHWEDYRPK